MHVVFGIARDVEVDDEGEFLDVEPAGGDVGGDEHVDRAVTEGGESRLTFVLRLVAVNRVCFHAVVLQHARKTTAGLLLVDEDDHLLHGRGARALRLEELHEGVRLHAASHAVDLLHDGLGRLIIAGDFDEHGIGLEKVRRELFDLGREGGREHEALTVRRKKLQDARYVREKAHVEHAVGFVEDDHLHLRELHGLLFDVVQEAPRRRRKDFKPAAQHVGLRTDVHPSVDDPHAKRRLFGVSLEVFRNLNGKFARRRQNEGAHRVARGRHRSVGLRKNAREKRQSETRGLPGPRLRRPHHVAPCEHDGDGLFLNRRGRLVAHAFNGRKKTRIKMKIGKRRHLRE